MKRGYRFDGKRYVTKGVMADIPTPVQFILWSIIDKIKEECPLDYLQVFRLKKKKLDDMVVQHIVHSQEAFAPFIKEYNVVVDSPVDAKVYVIDDVEHQTMLLAEEY